MCIPIGRQEEAEEAAAAAVAAASPAAVNQLKAIKFNQTER